MPVGTREVSRGRMSARVCRRPLSPASAAKRLATGASGSTTDSTRVFQAWQWGHWPCQRGDLPPHSEQT